MKPTASGTGNGSSWANASGNLQAMINASTASTQIWVATGVYSPGPNRGDSFAMKNNVAIYGGFAGYETTLSQRVLTYPANTTLTGNSNNYHVIRNPVGLTNTAVLDGFMITGGNATAATASFPDNSGGGMFNNGRGAGNSCSPLVRNCLFLVNIAENGGALYNDGTSGGNSSPVLINCSFELNLATHALAIGTGGGGAVYNDGRGGNANFSLTNCSFLSNRAINGEGGAIYNNCSSGNARASLTNCSFQANRAKNLGYTIFNDGSTPNTGPTLTNCVLWDASGGNTLRTSGASVFTIRYSLFDSRINSIYYTDGPGNLKVTGSPFPSSTDTRLGCGSVAIDAGDPASTIATAGATDLAGNPRFYAGTRIDMGAYELTGATSSPTRFYVRAGATGANTGLTWADAFTDLQSALNYYCSGNLTEIWVAAGLYKPTASTNRNISFAMKNRIAIYGGFAGTETALSQRVLTSPLSTTLSGNIGDAATDTDNSYHVISNPSGLTTTALLDGFVITGGKANGNFPDNTGGGMYNNGTGTGNGCSPLIRNCLFSGNMAVVGGAINNNGSSGGNSSPVLTNCAFQSNNATIGGAINNSGYFGNSSPSLTNCSFQGNSAGSGGGGVLYNYGESGRSSPSLTNCVVWGNGGANTFVNSIASITTRYSLFESSVTSYTTGPGNLTATSTPFASSTSTQLAATSPAINAGDPASTTATVGTIDLAGSLRFVGGRIDMGAYEFCVPPSRLYVRAGATGAGTGLSWADAFPYLQSALTYYCAGCSFQSNSASSQGGAVTNDGSIGGSSNPVLTNCSFQANTSANNLGGAVFSVGYQGSSRPVLTNCVVWGNSGASTFYNGPGAFITTGYSFFESSATGYNAGTGNVTASTSPFASTTSTLLAANSPAINAGDPASTTATVGTIDLAGNPRFTGGRIDMGAYEFQSLPSEVFSLKNGSWNDTSLWSVGRLPLAGERVRLKHSVTIPANFTALGGRLLYDPLGKLIYTTPGGRLRLGQ